MSMIPDETPTTGPGPGHNQPPDPIALVTQAQTEALAAYEKRKGEIIAAANRKLVTDRITASEAGDIIGIAAEIKGKIDAERMTLTDPYRKAHLAGTGLVEQFWADAEDALAALRTRLKEWNDDEEARIKKQRDEQDEAMRAMRAGAQTPDAAVAVHRDVPARAAAPTLLPAKRRVIKGDLGSRVASVERSHFTVTDVRAVPDWILNTGTVKEAIVQVVRSMAKHAGDIPGIEKSTSTDVQVTRN